MNDYGIDIQAVAQVLSNAAATGPKGTGNAAISLTGSAGNGITAFNDIGMLLLGTAPVATTDVGTNTAVSTKGTLTIKGTGGTGVGLDNLPDLAKGVVINGTQTSTPTNPAVTSSPPLQPFLFISAPNASYTGSPYAQAIPVIAGLELLPADYLVPTLSTTTVSTIVSILSPLASNPSPSLATLEGKTIDPKRVLRTPRVLRKTSAPIK